MMSKSHLRKDEVIGSSATKTTGSSKNSGRGITKSLKNGLKFPDGVCNRPFMDKRVST